MLRVELPGILVRGLEPQRPPAMAQSMHLHVLEEDAPEALALPVRVRPDDEEVPEFGHLFGRERLFPRALYGHAMLDQNALECV